MKLCFHLNGTPVELDVAPERRALDVLREDLRALPGHGREERDAGEGRAALDVKEGCGTGECGVCSILVDGVHKLACLMLAAQLEGRNVTTAAGLGTVDEPHAVQRAFAELGAVQCGFCTPGMEIAAAAFLARNPAPTREEARRALSGNLCRCTGYVKIVDAVLAAAATQRAERGGGPGAGESGAAAAGAGEGA